MDSDQPLRRVPALIPLPEGTPESSARAINAFRKAALKVLREMILGRQTMELVFDEEEEG